MSEEKKSPDSVRPFFIQAKGAKGNYVSSAQVVYLYAAEENNKPATALYVSSDPTKYTNIALVHAPIDTVKDVFREHGYDFVSHDDMAAVTAKNKAPQPS